jgi:hypothetical protein
LRPIDLEVLRIGRQLMEFGLVFVVVVVDQVAKDGAVIVIGRTVLEAASPDGGAEVGSRVQILVSPKATLSILRAGVVTPIDSPGLAPVGQVGRAHQRRRPPSYPYGHRQNGCGLRGATKPDRNGRCG